MSNENNQPKKKQRKNIPSDVNLLSRKNYNKFIKETGRKDITYEMFSSVPEMVHQKMVEKIYTQSYYIKIPELGVLKLFKVKPFSKSGARIDWKHFQKTGERVLNRNSHTNGYMFKVHLYLNHKKNPTLSCFDFHLNRTHKRNLAKLIFNNKVK